MRVLILAEFGAPSRYWQGVIPVLEANGAAVTMATVSDDGPLHERARELGAHSLALRCDSSLGYLPAALKLSRVIRRNEVDVVHASEAIPAAIGGLAGWLSRDTARIYHWHHTRVYGSRQRLLSQAGGRLANKVIACSCTAARYAAKVERIPPDRITVVYNGVDEPRRVHPSELAEIRRRLGIDPEDQVVSMLGRLRQEKGVTTLLDAFPRVTELAERPVHLVVAGDGAQRGELEAHARRVDSTRIHFVGHQEDIAPWLELGDVVAMPSERESFGLVAVEAMAQRRPLVASAVGGLTEIVEDGITGRLVSPGRPADLAAAIVDLLRSPATARKLGSFGYSRYRELFTMETMVSGFLRCYRELMSDGIQAS
jgi:glycosyltransferase involved in cell wall biosynthesis